MARLIVVALLLLPTIVLVVGLRQAATLAGAGRDPVVDGVVLRSEVVRLEDPGIRIGEPSTFTWRPVVTYSFSYAGKRHVGRRVSLFNEAASEAWASDVAATYTPGEVLRVRLRKGNPATPYLTRGGGPLVPATLITLGALPLIWFAVGSLSARRASSRASCER